MHHFQLAVRAQCSYRWLASLPSAAELSAGGIEREEGRERGGKEDGNEEWREEGRGGAREGERKRGREGDGGREGVREERRGVGGKGSNLRVSIFTSWHSPYLRR